MILVLRGQNPAYNPNLSFIPSFLPWLRRRSHTCMNQSIIISGGGTGGHLFPGIALYQEISRHQLSVRFLCTDRTVDEYVKRRWDLDAELLPFRRWPGIQQVSNRFIRDMIRSFRRTFRVFRQLQPDAVFGLGGYGSVPGLVAAICFRLPIYLLEQNVIPGSAVRLFGPVANKVFLSWESAQRYLPRQVNCETVGNPLRREVYNAPSRKEVYEKWNISREETVLLVMGGSQGAKSINEWIVSSLDDRDCPDHFRVFHVAGNKHFETIQSQYEELSVSSRVFPFYPRMEELYMASDLVISRAGGTSISELIHLEKPMVLIPYPYAKDNHQLANAKCISDRDAAKLLKEANLSPTVFWEEVWPLVRNEKRRSEMSENTKKMRKNNPAKTILRTCLRDLKK